MKVEIPKALVELLSEGGPLHGDAEDDSCAMPIVAHPEIKGDWFCVSCGSEGPVADLRPEQLRAFQLAEAAWTALSSRQESAATGRARQAKDELQLRELQRRYG